MPSGGVRAGAGRKRVRLTVEEQRDMQERLERARLYVGAMQAELKAVLSDDAYRAALERVQRAAGVT